MQEWAVLALWLATIFVFHNLLASSKNGMVEKPLWRIRSLPFPMCQAKQLINDIVRFSTGSRCMRFATHLYKMISDSITARLAIFSSFVDNPSHLDWFVRFLIFNGFILLTCVLVDSKFAS